MKNRPFEDAASNLGGQPQINKLSADGKPEVYRTVLRQSRTESELVPSTSIRRNLYSEQMK